MRVSMHKGWKPPKVGPMTSDPLLLLPVAENIKTSTQRGEQKKEKKRLKTKRTGDEEHSGERGRESREGGQAQL